MISSSCTAPTSGIMISGRGSRRPDGWAAASAIARTCMVEQARDDQPEPYAAQAEHRVLLVQPVHGLQQPQVVLVGLAPRPRRRATRTDSSVMSGRNSCSGGSSRRMVTGRPSIASRISTKSLAAAAAAPPAPASRSLVALGQDQPLDLLAPLAEEHVLGAAQADALGAEPAGPLARPRRCRRWPAPAAGACASACAMIRCTARDQLVAVAARRSAPSKYSTTGEATTGTSPGTPPRTSRRSR